MPTYNATDVFRPFKFSMDHWIEHFTAGTTADPVADNGHHATEEYTEGLYTISIEMKYDYSELLNNTDMIAVLKILYYNLSDTIDVVSDTPTTPQEILPLLSTTIQKTELNIIANGSDRTFYYSRDFSVPSDRKAKIKFSGLEKGMIMNATILRKQ